MQPKTADGLTERTSPVSLAAAQDIRVYLIWLALFGKEEHRVQIRYRRGCVPKDEAKNSYHSQASYRAHENPSEWALRPDVPTEETVKRFAPLCLGGF